MRKLEVLYNVAEDNNGPSNPITTGSSDPTVSIVICNYNYADYLHQSIGSALRQTYEKTQIVIVDDGSTDGSSGVINQYTGIEKIWKRNGGQTSAVRAALPHIRGEIVILLDADDWLKDNTCAKVVELWSKDVSLVQFRLQQRDDAGRIYGEWPVANFVEDDALGFVLKRGSLIGAPTSGNAFSRSHLAAILSFPELSDRAWVDGALIFSSPLSGKVRSINEVLGFYRVHGRNASTSTGITPEKMTHALKMEFSHRCVLVAYARHQGLELGPPAELLSSHDWRWMLLLARMELYPVVKVTRWLAMKICIRKFANEPHLTVRNKMIQILFTLTIALAPRSTMFGLQGLVLARARRHQAKPL